MVHRSWSLRPLVGRAVAAVLAALLPLLAGAATASAEGMTQEGAAPPLSPARDVAVTYRLAGPGDGAEAKEMRIAWLTAEGRLRLDLPAELGGILLVDRGAARAFLVMDQERLVVELPLGGDLPRFGELPPGARLLREGQDQVAGLPCTVWRYQDREQSGRACITADGVLLRASGPGAGAGDGGALEAVAVAYGPQDPTRFRPPPGYRSMRAAPPADEAAATRTAGR